jgi:hypothetical protein
MELKDLGLRIAQMEKRQRWMTAGLAVLVLIAVAWPLALAGFAVLNDKPASTIPMLTEPNGTPAHASEAPAGGSSAKSPVDRDRTAAAQP